MIDYKVSRKAVEEQLANSARARKSLADPWQWLLDDLAGESTGDDKPAPTPPAESVKEGSSAWVIEAITRCW